MNVKKVLKAGLKSPITTWTGVATALTSLALNFLYLVDANPDTNPDAETVGLLIMGIFVFIQGLVSRDADVTSEESKG